MNRDSSARRLIFGADSSALSAARSLSISVASTSTQTVASGISRRDRLSLSATDLRRPRIGIRVTPAGSGGRRDGRRRLRDSSRLGPAGIDRRVDIGAGDQPAAAGTADGRQVNAGVPGQLPDQR